MKRNLTIQQRLILPIVLLGVVALISNALAVFSINNVHSNAANIVDKYMVGETKLGEIRSCILDIHKMALAHIVATDYNTMIQVVTQIKAQEEILETSLEDYKNYVEEDATYEELVKNYDSFKHALVFLLCASAGSKTEEAYTLANGDVATYGEAVESNVKQLYASISAQAEKARQRLRVVYIISIIIGAICTIAGIILVLFAIKIILKYVIGPIKDAIKTLQGNSVRLNDVVNEVLKRTRNSNKSAVGLSSLAEELSATVQEVAGNAADINYNTAHIKQDVNDTAEECSSITQYSTEMKERADELEQSAQSNMEVISQKAADISAVLTEAIQQSRSVDQVNLLTDEIVGISTSTNLIAINASIEATRAGKSGGGFAIVAAEIRQLADSCSETAGRIQEVNKVVTSAVHTLSGHAQDLLDYMNQSILTQFQEVVESGKQYQKDAAYIQQSMDEFNSRTARLQSSMTEIASSIESITRAMDQSASGISGVAGSTRNLVGDMEDITGKMDISRGIVEDLKHQTQVFANL